MEVAGPSLSRAVGVVLYLHGGGWYSGVDYVKAMRPGVPRFTQLGWRVFTPTYNKTTRAPDLLDLIVAYYDLLDSWTNKPICVAGGSAGGHLALCLAAERDPACVVAEGAPVDMRGPCPEGKYEQCVWVWDAFGTAEADLERASPAARAEAITAPVLAAYSEDDSLVRVDLATAFLAEINADTHVLSPGELPFVHGTTTQEDLTAYTSAFTAFLNDHS